MHIGTLRWATAKRSGCVIQKFNELLQDFGVFVRRIAPRARIVRLAAKESGSMKIYQVVAPLGKMM